jgi:hypothetical protein
MSKNFAISLFFVCAAILLFLVWLRTGQVNFPDGNDAIWFNAGLFTLLIGTFITEYRFTKPNDVFVNCLTAFASISTLSSPPYEGWWQALRWGAFICGAVAVILAWDPGQEAKLRGGSTRAALYKIVTTLGSARVIFSLVFILGLISYFDLQNAQSKIFVLAWGGFLLSALIDLPDIARQLWKRTSKDREVIGVTHSFLDPSIVYCSSASLRRVSLHDLVGFAQSLNEKFHSFGVVIGTRSSASENRVVIALLNSSIDQSNFNSRTLVCRISDEELEQVHAIIGDAEINLVQKIVGTVARRTSISQLRFEIIGSPAISAGSLLRVKTSHGRPTFFQVFDGVVEEEETIKDSLRAFVEGQAEQIGCWSNERGGFETHDWVPVERSCVRLVDNADLAPIYELKPAEATIGAIPNSKFPVNVNVNDLVLYHSAILGVTGSGKSFLTFSLIESCVAKGIKVVCIDPTGDYQRYLANAVILSQQGSLTAFLNSHQMIGIIETGRAGLNPIRQTKAAADACLNWCKENRTQDEILQPHPKVLIVLEEAHLLIPEWTFNTEKGLQEVVNLTSQVVLQSRKFGLGFLVVSQRTANVVKSVLNQCNTIFSFQAFDETGFDFLKNYMGAFHVHSLPNLKSRHCILVGKASRSQRPIMVRFDEQNRGLQQQPAPDMAVPEVVHESDVVLDPPVGE